MHIDACSFSSAGKAPRLYSSILDDLIIHRSANWGNADGSRDSTHPTFESYDRPMNHARPVRNAAVGSYDRRNIQRQCLHVSTARRCDGRIIRPSHRSRLHNQRRAAPQHKSPGRDPGAKLCPVAPRISAASTSTRLYHSIGTRPRRDATIVTISRATWPVLHGRVCAQLTVYLISPPIVLYNSGPRLPTCTGSPSTMTGPELATVHLFISRPTLTPLLTLPHNSGHRPPTCTGSPSADRRWPGYGYAFSSILAPSGFPPPQHTGDPEPKAILIPAAVRKMYISMHYGYVWIYILWVIGDWPPTRFT